MEQFNDLLEPLDLYKSRLKDGFHANAEKLFDEMQKEANINVEENQEACHKYYKECGEIENLSKAIKKKKTARGFALFFGVLLAIAIVGIFLLIKAKSLKQEINNMSETLAKHEKARDEALDHAYRTMAPLNDKYDWNMAAGLMSKTTPLIQLDKVFDNRKFEFLHEKFGYQSYQGRDMSTVAVQSGSILGNPFVFTKNYVQNMVDHVYTGTRVVTYTVRVSDGRGGTRTQTVTQTLTARLTKPVPNYYYDTWLIYGNEAAPRLSFSRTPTNVNSMNDKQIERYVKGFDKELDKMVKKSLSKGGTFTRLANEEFEALFDALDRDNETEFRLLFTPLAQRNMCALLKDKEIGYGDDFDFIKKQMLNYIRSNHLQGSNILDINPKDLQCFDYTKAKEIFVAYCDRYLKEIYFAFAPLLSIPVYQQQKTREYIYQGLFKNNITQEEAECAANAQNVKLFAHPSTRSVGVILKSRFKQAQDKADICEIDAHSFSGTDQVTYVPVVAGNGKFYDVPVSWVEYSPITKSNQMVVGDSETDLPGFNALYNTGKFNKMIGNFDTSNGIIYKKRLFSFVLKDK